MLGGSKSRILIVDDEPDITEILSDLLGEEYDCHTANSAEAALERLGELDFQLVVSDITMPGMSGLEMIPLVKEVSPNTVVVMISGVQTVESAIGALPGHYVCGLNAMRKPQTEIGCRMLDVGCWMFDFRSVEEMGIWFRGRAPPFSSFQSNHPRLC